MQIVCPNCHINYIVADEKIGSTGRRVKCSKCLNIWHYTPARSQLNLTETVITNTDNPLAEEQKPQDTSVPVNLPNQNADNEPFIAARNLGVNLPVRVPLSQEHKNLFMLPLMLLLLILSIAYILIVLRPYEKFNEINIENVKVSKQNNASRLIVQYQLKNNGREQRKLSLIRIRVYNQQNQIIKSHVDNVSNIILLPNQKMNVNTEFKHIDANAHHVDLTLGGKINFIFK